MASITTEYVKMRVYEYFVWKYYLDFGTQMRLDVLQIQSAENKLICDSDTIVQLLAIKYSDL